MSWIIRWMILEHAFVTVRNNQRVIKRLFDFIMIILLKRKQNLFPLINSTDSVLWFDSPSLQFVGEPLEILGTSSYIRWQQPHRLLFANIFINCSDLVAWSFIIPRINQPAVYRFEWAQCTLASHEHSLHNVWEVVVSGRRLHEGQRLLRCEASSFLGLIAERAFGPVEPRGDSSHRLVRPAHSSWLLGWEAITTLEKVALCLNRATAEREVGLHFISLL